MTDKDIPTGTADPVLDEGLSVPTDVLIGKLRSRLEAAEWRALMAETYIEQLQKAAATSEPQG